MYVCKIINYFSVIRFVEFSDGHFKKYCLTYYNRTLSQECRWFTSFHLLQTDKIGILIELENVSGQTLTY